MRGYGNNHVGEDHVGANPVTGIGWELRRTAGNILAIEEELAHLRENELIEGTKTVTKRAFADELREVIGDVGDEDEAPSRPVDQYTIVTFEQRLHLWGELYLRERKHYGELVRLAFAVGFEKRKIELIESQVADLNAVITGVIRRLGRDPHEPEMRSIVREEILAIMPVPA